MLIQLKHCGNSFYCNHEQVQNAFAICNLAWKEVKDKLSHHRFSDEDEEIEFFKKIKPRFTSMIEYYCLIYHSVLFEPDDAVMSIEFWKRECSRLEKFRAEHKGFIACYQNNRCLMDRHYFLRKYFTESSASTLKIYDDRNTVTNGDLLVTVLMALTKYDNYSTARLVLYGTGDKSREM